jgi:hypothetical protein
MLWTEAGRQYGLAFKPRPSDVIITPYGKSGTTWLQQIVHGLRTRGDMDFDDISRVVPWIEVSHSLGIDLDAPQRAEPRAFKSHLAWDDVPKGGRYLLSVRDPKDALVSMYRFLEGWWFETGSIPIATIAREVYMANREAHGYWRHLASWWPRRRQENVLMLAYENMQADLPGTIRRIARFIGCELDEALLALVVRQSSFDFMLAYKDKFDDRLIRERAEQVGALPPGSDSAKVRNGRVGAHRLELPADISREMDQIWQAEITRRFGLASYQNLRAVLAEEAD